MKSIYHKVVSDYCAMAMTPIPMKFKSKQPAIENWTKFTIEDERDIERYFVEPINIGVLTGKPSNNLIDVDIDHPDALKCAPYFPPETYCIFGRASKRRSYWVYRVPHPGNRMSFAADRMIVEVRGNGCCTLFPESIHPSGEKVEFDNPKDFIPDRSTWAKLTQATKQIALATVLYPYWSKESHCRHALALAVAAFLARREWKQEDVTKLVEAIAKEANDEESEDRSRGVDDTFAAYAQGRSISGDEELVQLIGAELVGHIEKWVSGKASKKRQKSRTGNSSGSGAGGAVDITTDAAAADAFATAFKNRLVYCNGQWFHREVQVLEPVNAEFVQGLAKQFFQEQVGKLAGGPFGSSAVKSSLSRARINAAVELSRSSFHADGASIDNDIDLLGLADGSVFDLKTGNVIIGNRALVTKKVRANLVCGAACPSWINFLNEIFAGDADVIQFIRRAVGFSLSGSVSEQCLFILIGTGANGKSTFLKVLQTVFGGYSGLSL